MSTPLSKSAATSRIPFKVVLCLNNVLLSARHPPVHSSVRHVDGSWHKLNVQLQRQLETDIFGNFNPLHPLYELFSGSKFVS
jgi:hypothetical protein